jgi:hypothetical protein
MALLRWRIYYDDGTTFDNLDGRFEDAPADGVLGVVVRDADIGRQVLHGADYYYLADDDEQTVAYSDDLGPFLRQWGRVKFGRWVGNTKYSKVVQAMITDPDFPPKSAKKEVERL